MSTINVIFTHAIHGNKVGTVVKVKGGYARNFLIPMNYAVYATPKAVQQFEEQRVALELKAQEQRKIAIERVEVMKTASVTLSYKAGNDGKLYGSVSKTDISKAISDTLGFDIEPVQIIMHQKLSMIGTYSIAISLYEDVEATLTVNVQSAVDEQ
ncbi:50S ribosomal protein L9 [Candidatus Fokinia solitaria]|uniref:Large ribosomal subunit protein bL9 n=1 Tax=Candidatus Fokinia solitaria TaxID=1802984 RepID=A0A2U8BRH4_9RICK|nr:50S ribosomal protein L9 [Candidatus Fokinia solitaria]AWD32870.1 50S ribosomal protein L9 [Candidatus Fokinia solitaria]